MLRQVGHKTTAVGLPIAKAVFPAPFTTGLTYSPPVRGTWNIVHVGMLVPEAHMIFVCAQGCLRGVVLTAAEMGAEDRFSTIAVREQNVLNGDMESLMIDGVSDILDKLPQKPPAVMIYSSCIHHFMGVDLALVYRTLRGKYPDIQFTDCYMNPIMRKSGLNPDQIMRRQMYSFLKPASLDAQKVTIVGNEFPLDEANDISAMLKANGISVQEVTTCDTYSQYQDLARSETCIVTQPAAKPAGQWMGQHLKQHDLYLPFSWDFEEIETNLATLAKSLQIPQQDLSDAQNKAQQALKAAAAQIGHTPIAIDYTATTRPLGLAKLLLDYGFNVTAVFLDNFMKSEAAVFKQLQLQVPDLSIYPTTSPEMRVIDRDQDEKVLAVGQKAAYYMNTNYFVNLLENGGLYGFNGIAHLAQMLQTADATAKPMRQIVEVKGWGCNCVL